jgi:hypothetical protein
MRTKVIRAVSAFALVAVAAGVVAAQPPPQAEKLPSGETVLARYVEASGGIAAFQALKTRFVKATMEIPSAGVVLGLTIYAAAPDRTYTLAESDVTGKIESGTTDGVAWEISPQRGAIVKTGPERDDAMRDAILDRMVHWKDTVKTAECVGIGMIDSKPAFKVVVTPKTGSAQTFYFDRTTGLVLQVESVAVMPGGTVTVFAKPSDYRKVDGVLIPFTNRVTLVEIGQDRVVTVQKVEHNTDVPASRFALPAEIKALVPAKK